MDEEEFEEIESNAQWSASRRYSPGGSSQKRITMQHKDSLVTRHVEIASDDAMQFSPRVSRPVHLATISSQSPSHQTLDSTASSIYSPYSAKNRNRDSLSASFISASPRSSGPSPKSSNGSVVGSSPRHSLASTLHQNESVLQNPDKYAQKLSRSDELRYLRNYNEKLKEDMVDLKERHKKELQALRQQLQTEKENFLREQNLVMQQKLQARFEDLKANHEEVLLSQMNQKFVQSIKSEKSLQYENKSLSNRINNLTRDLNELRSEYRILSLTNQKLEKENLLAQSREKELNTKIMFLKSRVSALTTAQPRDVSTDVRHAGTQTIHAIHPQPRRFPSTNFSEDDLSFAHNKEMTIDTNSFTDLPDDESSSADEQMVGTVQIPDDEYSHPDNSSITLENIRADVSIELDFSHHSTTDDDDYSNAIRTMEQMLSGHPSLMSTEPADKENDTLTLSEVGEDDISHHLGGESTSELSHESVIISTGDEETLTNLSDELALHEEDSLPDSFEISRMRKRKRKIQVHIDRRDKSVKKGMKSISEELSVIATTVPDLVQYITELMRSHKGLSEKNSILEIIVERTGQENARLHEHIREAMQLLNDFREAQAHSANTNHASSAGSVEQTPQTSDQQNLLAELELLRDAYENVHNEQEKVLREYQGVYEEKLKVVENQLASYRAKYGELDSSHPPVLQVDLSTESESQKRKTLSSSTISNVPRLFRDYKRTDRLIAPTSLIKRNSVQQFELVCLGTEQVIVQCGYNWVALNKNTKGKYQFAGSLPIHGSGITVHVKRESNSDLPPGILASKGKNDSKSDAKTGAEYEKILYFADKTLYYYPGSMAIQLQMRGVSNEQPFNLKEKGLVIFSMSCQKGSPPLIPQLLDASTKLEVDQKCFVESAVGHPSDTVIIYHFSILLSSSINYQFCLYAQMRQNEKLEMLCRFPVPTPKNSPILRTRYPVIHTAWSNLQHKRLYSPRKHSLDTGILHHFHMEVDSCESVELCFISVDNDENWIEMRRVSLSVMDVDIAEWECDFESTVRGVLSIMIKNVGEGSYQRALEFVLE